MIKTCLNCRYFKSCLSDSTSYYHIHNYCSLWDRTFPNLQKSFVTSFLDDHYNDLLKLNEKNPELNICICDDIECGLANCYMFTPKEEYDDTTIKNRFRHNKELILLLIDEIIKNGFITCGNGGEYVLDDDDIIDYKNLRSRVENLQFEVDKVDYRLGE